MYMMWSYCVRHFISKFRMSIGWTETWRGHCWDLWNRKKAGGCRWNHCHGRWNSDSDFGYYRALTGKCPSNVPQDDPQGVAQDVAQGKNVSEDVGSSNRTSTGQVQPYKLPPQVHPTSTRQVAGFDFAFYINYMIFKLRTFNRQVSWTSFQEQFAVLTLNSVCIAPLNLVLCSIWA